VNFPLFIIRYHFYAGSLKQYIRNKPCCEVYSVAAVVKLKYMIHVMLLPMLNVLYFYCRTLRSSCAKSNMDVLCCSLISLFPGMFFRYGMKYFELPYYYWYHICFYIPHVVRSLYFRFFRLNARSFLYYYYYYHHHHHQ